MKKMKKAVVTGGAGFIASHWIDKLLSEGWSVIAIDNLITGRIENVIQHTENPNFEFIRQDVTEYLNISGELDWVFHFASPASPIDFIKFPIQTLKVGALGSHKALGLAKEKNAKFMLTSTSEVYGDPLEHPQSETYWGNVNPVGTRGVYDESKRFAEAMTMAYHRFHKVDTRIARLFNTYGPRMRMEDGRVVPNFLAQALRNDPLTLYGTGNQTRSFGYISEIIDGLWRLAHTDYNFPINIGNPEEHTIAELAKIVIRSTGSKSETIFCDSITEDDPQRRRPDIAKARKLLGWEPKIDIEEGLKLTIEQMKKGLG